MAVTSTKDTSQSTSKTHAGKKDSANMPLGTTANTHTPTLQEVAQNLVALELDLKDLVATGLRWTLKPYLAATGKVGLVAFLYHPNYSLGVEDLGNNNLVATIEGKKASEVATRKEKVK